MDRLKKKKKSLTCIVRIRQVTKQYEQTEQSLLLGLVSESFSIPVT